MTEAQIAKAHLNEAGYQHWRSTLETDEEMREWYEANSWHHLLVWSMYMDPVRESA